MKKRRYASGQLGLTLVSESFGTYLAFFYLERLGLSAALYALARTVYALWDAVNDPLFGEPVSGFHLVDGPAPRPSSPTTSPWPSSSTRPWPPWSGPTTGPSFRRCSGASGSGPRPPP